MLHRVVRSRSLYLGLTAAAFAGLGGCPVAQQPNQNENTNTNSSVTSNTNSSATPDLPRPIPPVPTDTTTTTGGSNSSNANSGNPGGGGGGGNNPPGSVVVGMISPQDPTRSRPGAIVEVEYDLSDPSGALQTVELLIARDEDQNGQPDGAPIEVRSLAATAGRNSLNFDTNGLTSYLSNGIGRFLLGVRTTSNTNVVSFAYASGLITIDSVLPTSSWVSPDSDNLVSTGSSWQVQVSTSDNAAHTVRILLDPDLLPESGNEFEFQAQTQVPAGTATRSFTRTLIGFPSNTYNYFVIVSDGIAPPLTYYVQNTTTLGEAKLAITNRLIGNFDLSLLAGNNANGGILQGFNLNDLAGSSISTVPDLNDDGRDELIVGARFAKSFLVGGDVGFGEGYMIYGSNNRIRGTRFLNSAGVDFPGLIFPGIRTPIAAAAGSVRWTKGIADITVIPDMDGDALPEIVFSFPRAESINIGEANPTIQLPELVPDLGGMGNLEYNAFYGNPPTWRINESQFTRGGIVIVSSHNSLLQDPTITDRKSNRVMDLHEVGQLFSGMGRPGFVPYIRTAAPRIPAVVCADCDGLPPAGCEEGDPMATPPEPGQCGDDTCGIGRPELIDGKEQEIQRWVISWDVIFNNQGPGGFHQPWTIPPATPPLANPSAFPYPPTTPFPFGFYPNHWVPIDACTFNNGCEVTNQWYSYGPTLPGTSLAGTPSWATGGVPAQTLPNCYPNNPCVTLVTPDDGPCPSPSAPCSNPAVNTSATGAAAWTGFAAPDVIPYVSTAAGDTFETPVGARVLGQKVDDQFGTAIGADGTWLYVSAPERTANDAPYTSDIPTLAGSRSKSGVVYQIRTRATVPGDPQQLTRTQLWMERGTRTVPNPIPGEPPIQVVNTWPFVEGDGTEANRSRTDYTMPVPHQFIVESIGSIRGNPAIGVIDTLFGTEGGNTDCPPSYEPGVDQADATAITAYTPYPVGTAGYYMDRTPQIVGPHTDARISFVRALGDINDDGIRDFAVGSDQVKKTSVGGGNVQFNGAVVGSIFIVFGRAPGVEGDYLLEQLAFDPANASRLNGVLLQGATTGERLARVFDDAGDFDGDGIEDVIIGNEGANGGAGEAIVIFGSTSLLSPIGGWTVADAVAAGRAIRFRGVGTGDLLGANVAGAGDVDGDGIGDILLSAPGAEGGKGVVYLIYGKPRNQFASLDLSLATTGSVNLQGARLIGRSIGDSLGAGSKGIINNDPNGGNTTAYSRGVSRLGDIDGDGRDDYAVGSMLASPGGRTNAGEVYVLYGRGDGN